MNEPTVRNLAGLALAVSLSALCAPASATVLTLDGPGLADFVAIPGAYGDRVTTFDDVVNGFQYGSEGGLTPNIVLDYIAEGEPLAQWPTGYGDLSRVIGDQSLGLGEVVLTPDAGYSVTLLGIDVAPWDTDYVDCRVLVLDAAGTILFDSGFFDAQFDDGHYHFAGPIESTSALRIINTAQNGQLGFGYLGLDNVSFSQTPAAVPVPAAFPLLLSGIAGLGLIRRRRG